MSRRVVITGLGCVTPLGADVSGVWDRLLRGESGVGSITTFDASSFPVRIAAEVRDWDLSDVGEEPTRWASHPRQTQFAVGAALKAARGAGLAADMIEPVRLGVYLGCGEIFPDFVPFAEAMAVAYDGKHFEMDRFLKEYSKGTHPDADTLFEPGDAVRHIASLLNAQGPSMNITNACVSSTAAIGEASEVIRRGDADAMLAGGSHSMIHPLGVSGFHRLSTLSMRNDEPERASRPFDRDRDGFVVGEGAAVVILEELEHARRRGADIWAELTGYGSSDDAFRVTDPCPDARGASRCMELALQDARLTADDLDYINAHGTGTAANDKVETAAIKRALGERAYKIPISSTKSMTGHLTTACGGLELLFCVLAIRHGIIPPTTNYETLDPDCDLDYVPNALRELDCRHVMNNNFGFGGQNVALVASRFEG